MTRQYNAIPPSDTLTVEPVDKWRGLCLGSGANRTTSPEGYNSEKQSGPEAVAQVIGFEQLEVRGRVRGSKCSGATVQRHVHGRLDCCDQYRLDEVAKGLRVLPRNGLSKEHWTASPVRRCCQWRCPRDSDGGWSNLRPGKLTPARHLPTQGFFSAKCEIWPDVRNVQTWLAEQRVVLPWSEAGNLLN
jgi:hypothetical protein